jgi:hypothetical protein
VQFLLEVVISPLYSFGGLCKNAQLDRSLNRKKRNSYMKYDIISFMVSFLLILAYYLYLGRRTHRAPDSSVHRLNARVRERWVDMIMTNSNMNILAIQTLRNSVMAANFMASASILFIIGTLNISEKIGRWALDWHP